MSKHTRKDTFEWQVPRTARKQGWTAVQNLSSWLKENRNCLLGVTKFLTCQISDYFWQIHFYFHFKLGYMSYLLVLSLKAESSSEAMADFNQNLQRGIKLAMMLVMLHPSSFYIQPKIVLFFTSCQKMYHTSYSRW